MRLRGVVSNSYFVRGFKQRYVGRLLVGLLCLSVGLNIGGFLNSWLTAKLPDRRVAPLTLFSVPKLAAKERSSGSAGTKDSELQKSLQHLKEKLAQEAGSTALEPSLQEIIEQALQQPRVQDKPRRDRESAPIPEGAGKQGTGTDPELLQIMQKRLLVVLDPGHGGHDSGTITKQLQEKNLTLALAKEVSSQLQKLGIMTKLTRDTDKYLSLAARTSLANNLDADLFVSIHVNSSPNRATRGVETYYLDVTSDRYALRLAALENRTSEKEVNDLQIILADLTTKVNTEESRALAEVVQEHLLSTALKVNPQALNLGVKGALFYVLLGARMPAILVETAFLSNSKDAELLADKTYQQRLGKSLALGIYQHLRAPLKLATP